ncbi:MAG: DNA polymerase Y family protein [Pseudomonadota bacterium]
MNRYLSIRLMDWPLTRWRRTQARLSPLAVSPGEEEAPFAIIEKNAHGLAIIAGNKIARQQGVTDGLRFTDAKARAPDLTAAHADRAAEAQSLRRLARWMIRWTPLVALDGDDGLILDIAGCDHLFDGETAMMASISACLTKANIPHSMGLASTVGAAIALALCAAPGTCPHLPPGRERDGVQHLPVFALRLSAQSLSRLRRFGLTRIGQLYDLDRKALHRRFASKEAADAVVLRLDQVLGLIREPINPLLPKPRFACRLPCAEPLISPEGIEAGLEHLSETLAQDLAASGQGAQRFTLHAFRADGTSALTSIATARPERLGERITYLFRERIHRIDPGYGIDLLMLTAHRLGAMTESSTPLSSQLTEARFDQQEASLLADKINARLGEGVVSIRLPIKSHIPERDENIGPFAGAFPQALPATHHIGPRPLRLLTRPEPVHVMAAVPDGPPMRLTWRRVLRRIIKAEGPERIAPEWWKQSEKGSRARDYYRVEDDQGRRYWVYRDGLYNDGRDTSPQWFMHGFFA